MRPFSVALVLTSGQLASCDVTASINSAVAAVKLESKNFCCEALSFALGSKVSYPNSTAYDLSLSSYFSQQESTTFPGCIVSAASTDDVAISVGILSTLSEISHGSPSCEFAIRSGGHSVASGQANIKLGVTLDLSSLDTLEVLEGNTVTSIGPGARWGEVYLYLDSLKLATTGGRVAEVGVGGLTTGGGISYFSPRQGFACDNVVNFEVVLAGGQIVNANATSNSDLWIALRGGSNNFGVVTRLDVITFEQGDMWGGEILYLLETVPLQIQALANFTNNVDYDPFASLIVSFAFAAGQGSFVENSFAYTKLVSDPPVFQPFTSIPNLENTARISNLTNFAIEQGSFSPNGDRQFWITTTIKATEEMITATFNLWNQSVTEVQSVAGLVWALSLEPIPPIISSKSASMGGNVLGLDPEHGALMVVLLAVSYTNFEDDDLVASTAEALFESIDSTAISLGAFDRFKYLNYAAISQDPIDSYGAQNKARLQAASRKYDPAGIFQRVVPGGFKLFT